MRYPQHMERSTLIPVEEYLSTSYRPDREYIDGVLLERNVGEWDHSSLQMALSAYVHTSEASHEVGDALRTKNPEILVPLDEIFPPSMNE